jgi:hypothetical protein
MFSNIYEILRHICEFSVASALKIVYFLNPSDMAKMKIGHYLKTSANYGQISENYGICYLSQIYL